MIDTHPELDMSIALDIESEETDPSHPPRFAVTDEYTAMVAVEKLRNIDEGIEKHRHVAVQRIQEIQQWLDNETYVASQRKAHLEAKLENWARAHIAEINNPKVRSIKLPGATLSVRKLPPEYVRDDATIMGWLKEGGAQGYIKEKVTESLDWSGLKADATVADNGTLRLPVADPETGEKVEQVIPSVQVVDRPDEFKLVVNP